MAVFAHGQLRLYLLALLDEGPRHGYEIIRALEDRFNGLYSPSAGTVYPRLAKLEEEGLVERSDEGRKAMYFITERGRAEVRARALELATAVRLRVPGRGADLGAEHMAAALGARAPATPAGAAHDQHWPSGDSTWGPASRDIEAAVNAFRHDVRDAVRRVQSDPATRQEVLDILHDAARRIRRVLGQPRDAG